MTVIIAFALARGGGKSSPAAKTSGPLPPVTVSAPPSDAAAEAPCAQVLSALPVKLGPLPPRVVHTQPDSPYVVAWGNPPVVLRCGVARPPRLAPDSSDLLVLVGGVYWLPVQEKASTVFTTVDRAVYVEVTVPKRVDYQPLPILGQAVAGKLKAVCAVPEPTATYRPSQLCTHRR